MTPILIFAFWILGIALGVFLYKRYDLTTEPRELLCRLGIRLIGVCGSCLVIFTVLFIFFKIRGDI